jgi:adenylate kinase family enzyme
MQGLEFPIVGAKTPGVIKKFDLSDLNDRKAYFEAKIGPEIKLIKKYLESGTFMAFLLGKKNSGKGTYSGLLREIFGKDNIATVGVGDLVRDVHKGWEDYSKTEEFKLAKKYYRGFISWDEAVERLHGRSTSALLPSEFILAVLKARLATIGKKAVFVDGLPRDIDQISYSLFFRDLANYRDDPDLFVMIDIPTSVIDERIKYRVVCPTCKSSRNLKLLVTKDIEYDQKDKKYYLLCDNPDCKGQKMLPKEGDDLGIGPIKDRLIKDEQILKQVFGLHGMPKILLRNHVPANEANQYFDDYELTPEFILGWDGKKVTVKEKSWTIKDDNGVESNSLMAPAVVVSLVKQLAEVLNLS